MARRGSSQDNNKMINIVDNDTSTIRLMMRFAGMLRGECNK
ncbi:MAG TPA: hypothetical protein VHK91_08955 [Flavisolibacter sp.]|nr:hypothetical protein [Flavisolibacter sp.]